MTGTDHGQPAQHSSLDSQARHDTWRETLKAIIAPIDNLPERIGRPGLADDILTYLLEGASPAVLTELSQRPRVGMYLNVLNQTGAVIYRHDWRAHYQSLQVAPAGVLLRWARVLEAFTWSHANKLMFSIDMPDGSRWTETLMLHSLNVTLDGHSTVRPSRQGIALDVIETLLREVNLSPAAFLEAAFARPKPYWLNTGRLLSITCLEGYSVAVTRHAACLRPHVLAKPLERRLHAMTLLKNLDDHDLQVFSKEIVELAVSESKQVQGSAQDMLFRIPQAAMEPLRQVATAATPEQRKLALGLIWTMARAEEDTAQLTFALEMARADKAASVRALVQEWELAEQTQHEQPAYTVPPVSWNHEMTPAFAAALDTLWSELNQLFVQRHEQSHEYRQTLQKTGRKKPAPQLDEIELGRLKHLLTLPGSELSAASVGRGFRYYLGHFHPGMLYPAFALFVHSQVVSPTELFKVLFFFNLIMQAECISNVRDSTRKSGLASVAIRLFGALYESTGRPSLLELSEMLKASGYPSEAVLYACCERWTSEPLPWNAEAVWPYLAEHEQLLTDTLANPDPGNYSLDRSKLFKLAATMPVLPEGLARTLFSLATGSAKGERLEAQATLSHYPGKQVHILTALVDGKAETRIAAAQWLGRLGDKQAIPNLEKALAKEKNDLVKGNLLDVLEQLGQPIEQYLDRNVLVREAEKSVAKGLPKELSWLNWGLLPQVRWVDTGEPVTTCVLQWILAQAVKQKSPEPNAVLRKYCTLFAPRNREALGQFLLESWLSEDTRPIPQEVALERAEASATWTFNHMRANPTWYTNSPDTGKTVEELTARLLPALLRQAAGSAINSKGLLAVVAACAGADAAAPVARYLKEYYGTRAAQGKALIAMLAWIDHPETIQLMLSVGNRFRTKSFQEEALRQAQALAERKNWTLSELADRTIPAAGFDDSGILELNYGGRVFVARVQPSLQIVLFSPEGKTLKALPAPRQSDDAELVKEAKKAFTSAKKSLKGIVDQQTERLYEALCTGREWSFADWNTCLNHHPIVRHLVQRLIWVHIENNQVKASFRPLDDGTLIGHDDNEICLPPTARIRLAHDLLMPGEAGQWGQHMLDYEVNPLFPQLGKHPYIVPPEKADSLSLEDFKGYLIETFSLRSRALKQGYTRGPVEDGGWFSTYEKSFITLGLVAVIEFTGNPVPEENRTAALLSLSFARAGDYWTRSQICLKDVPPILLSECYEDMRLMAGEGAGYAEDWEKKSEY